MNIRTKLTLIFCVLVVGVLTLSSASIYFLSSNYREMDFNRRLKNRAANTAKILVEVKEVNAELLKRMERINPASLPNQYIAIYNHRDEELYSSEGINVMQVDAALLRTIRYKKEIAYKIPGYEVLGFLFIDSSNQYTVVAAASDVYGLKAIENLRNILIITFCVSIILVAFIGWFYAGKVLRPISRIVDEVSTITEVNLSLRLDEGNQRDELGKLAKTFNRMLKRLQGAFTLQKSFIANASHEIKTPITTMSAEIEVGLMQDRDKSYYVNVLRSVLSGLKGLNRLSSQLLLLAQTSSENQHSNFSSVRVDDILWEVKAELLKTHPEYHIDILFDLNINHQSMVIDGDAELIKACLGNLMENGCKYSDDRRVAVTLHIENSDTISIEFVNSGRGIEPELQERIFEPFFRSKTYRQVKGFGIGLSLTKSIAAMHGGKIRVISQPNTETRFTLTFPIGEHA